MREEKWYERFFKWLLIKIGLIKRYEVTKEEMCELAKPTCNRHCKYCAWNTKEEEC